VQVGDIRAECSSRVESNLSTAGEGTERDKVQCQMIFVQILLILRLLLDDNKRKRVTPMNRMMVVVVKLVMIIIQVKEN